MPTCTHSLKSYSLVLNENLKRLILVRKEIVPIEVFRKIRIVRCFFFFSLNCFPEANILAFSFKRSHTEAPSQFQNICKRLECEDSLTKEKKVGRKKIRKM